MDQKGAKLSEVRQEILIICGFVVLSVVMTWPWVAHLRNAVRDEADPYAHAYFLWWDYHQTFHDPLHLFDATIFYPYHDTLAFGENDYGISLLLFPLFALGSRPLSAYSLAVFLSFPFTGYAMFRLARTLSRSTAIGWFAGVILTFIPYRFHQLSHLPLVFAGWIPLTFEALVNFVRIHGRESATLTNRKAWLLAGWLAVTFTMNALTCLSWFLMTLLPLALSAIILLRKSRAWRNRDLWVRAAAALAGSALVLVPFLIPYARVAQAHGFVRSAAEVKLYSAQWRHWFAFEDINRLWSKLATPGGETEMLLFPGLLPPLLALLGLFFVIRNSRSLDGNNFYQRIRANPDFEIAQHGLVLMLLGFGGSFGLNFILYRMVFQYFPLFRSMRVAARWAMICYLGLAMLAAIGAWRLVQSLNKAQNRRIVTIGCLVLMLAILFEQRVAPLPIVQGQVNPDEQAMYLKSKQMKGGIVELPAGERSHYYMLRAADHEHPLVTATNSFTPPLEQEIESLTRMTPISDRLIDVFESLPVSYVVVHNALMSRERRGTLEVFLDNNIRAGRLRFIRSFNLPPINSLPQRNDLYAVMKTEPLAQSESPPPPRLPFQGLEPLFSGLLVDFQPTGFLVYRLYKASLARDPSFAEFMSDVESLRRARPDSESESQTAGFVDSWLNRADVKSRFANFTDQQYLDSLLSAMQLTGDAELRGRLLQGLRDGSMTRSKALTVAIDDKAFKAREFNRAFVLMHYFVYLRRDPDPAGLQFWLNNLNRFANYSGFTEAFASATERQLQEQ